MPLKATRRSRGEASGSLPDESDTITTSTMMKSKSTIVSFEEQQQQQQQKNDRKLLISGDVTSIKPILAGAKGKKAFPEAWVCAFSNSNPSAGEDLFLALGYMDSVIAIYRQSTSEIQTYDGLKPRGAGSIAFSKNNKYLYVLHGSHLSVLELTMKNNNANNNQDGGTFTIDFVTTVKDIYGIKHLPCTRFSISPDGNLLCAASWGAAPVLFDIKQGTPGERNPKKLRQFDQIAYSEEEKYRPPEDAGAGQPAAGELKIVQSICFSKDGNSVFGVGSGGCIFSWDVETGKFNRPKLHAFPPSVFARFECLGFNMRFCTHEEKKSLAPMDLPGMPATIVEPCLPGVGFITAIELSPDGKTLAIAARSNNHQLQFINVDKWERIPIETKFPPFSLLNSAPHEKWVQNVKFHPNPETNTLVSCGFDYSLGVWDVETGLCSSKIRYPKESEVLACDFSQDGTWLCACVAKRGGVNLFRVE